MIELFPIDRIIIDTKLFQIRSKASFKKGRENIDRIKEQLLENPKFDVPAVWLWKDEKTDKVYLIDGFHRITAYIEAKRKGIPYEFKYCGDSENVSDAQFWVRENVNRHNSRPLDRNDIKKLFVEHCLDPRNLARDFYEIGKKFSISKNLVTRIVNQFNLKQRRQELIVLLNRQGTIASSTTSELEEAYFERFDISLWSLFTKVFEYPGFKEFLKERIKIEDLLDPESELDRYALNKANSVMENKGQEYQRIKSENAIAYLKYLGSIPDLEDICEFDEISLLKSSCK